MTVKKREKGKFGDDPLVPIDGERVRAAIELYRQVTIREAARRIGELLKPPRQSQLRQSTLQSIVEGRTSQCRSSLRKAIARYVGLPEPFLAGEQDDIPGIIRELPIPAPGVRQLGPLSILPTRAQVAARRVGVRVLKAFERDIRDGIAPRPHECSVLLRAWDNPPVRRQLFSIGLHELLNPVRLRASLLARPTDGSPPSVPDSEQDAIGTAVADSLEALLRPWLEGRETLNYSAFYRLLAKALSSSTWLTGSATMESKRRAKPARRKKKR